MLGEQDARAPLPPASTQVGPAQLAHHYLPISGKPEIGASGGEGAGVGGAARSEPALKPEQSTVYRMPAKHDAGGMAHQRTLVAADAAA